MTGEGTDGRPREEDGPRFGNRITGGRFGTVVQAERVDAVHIHVREEPAGRPRPAARLWLLAGGLVCAAAVLGTLAPGALDLLPVRRSAAAVALLAAATLVAAAATGRVLDRRRAARPRTPLPAHRLDQATERLAEALRRQYGREDQLALSPVTTPTPIPVRWRAADPLVTDHESNLLGTPADSTPAAGTSADSTPGAGRPADGIPAAGTLAAGTLEAEGEFAGIPAFFASLPRGRLVVLGAPGAGKTVLVHRLARKLLEARGPASAAPVPVVLPLASWNPGEGRGLWRWAAERMSAEHPVPLPTPEAALDLIESGRVLPVLDGFDELPGPGQAEALRQLRASLTAHARYVLTSRTREYTRAVDGAALPLPGAVAVELCPLTTGDLLRYLPRTSRRTSREDPGRTKWSPVLERLADPGDTARETRVLRRVLSTPLMVALARVAYSETGADPAELLGAGRFTTVQAVERHLYDAFLTAAYADAGPGRAERARGWAAFLAGHTRHTGGTEIAWWRLEEALPSWLRRLSVLPAVVTATLTLRFAAPGAPWWDRWVPVPLWAGFALVAFAYAWDEWGGRPARVPQQLRLPHPAGARAVPRTRRAGRLAGWALSAAGVVYLAGGLAGPYGRNLAAVVAAAFFGYAALRRAVEHVRRPADPETATEPARLLRRDRRATLVLGIAPTRDDGDPAWPWALPALMLAGWQLLGGRDVVGATTWLGTAAGAALSIWLHEITTSAWGRYTLARLWFAATGRLPWRLMDFLREAHGRGILRQAGGVYRFRHIELRNRLAADVPVRTRPDRRLSALGGPAAGFLAGLGGLVLLSVPLGVLGADGVPGPHPGPATACAVLSGTTLEALMADPLRVADGDTCRADEQAPFVPEVRVAVRLRVAAPGRGLSGAETAHRAFRSLLEQERSRWRVVRGSGRSGLPMSFDARSGPGGETVRVVTVAWGPDTGGPGLRQARYTARHGNLLVTVDYAEEFASQRRAAAVAESLLRRALGRTDARDPAGIPRARPPADSRLTRYRQPERRLHGAVWGRRERSYLWEFPLVSLRLRAPEQLTCEWEPRGSRVDEYDCARRTGPAARTVPRLRLHLAELSCGARCSRAESRGFAADRPGPAAVRWRTRGRNGPLFAVRRTAKEYELRLWTELPGGRADRQLWVSVRVPPRHAALAQKIVNSAWTQLGGR